LFFVRIAFALLSLSISSLACAEGHVKKHKHSSGRISQFYDLSVGYDSNVGRAEISSQVRDDMFTSAMVGARYVKRVTKFGIISYTGKVEYEAFREFTTLSNFKADITAKYKYAYSSGYLDPVYSVFLRLGLEDNDSDNRDATKFSFGWDMSKALTNRIFFTSGFNLRSTQSKSQVFDIDDARIFANFDYSYGKGSTIYNTYSYIYGDTVSTAAPNLKVVNYAKAIEPDAAFGGILTNQFAYRIPSETMVISLGLNKRISGSSSIDVSAQIIHTEADGDNSYDRAILRASYLGRF